MNSKKSFSGEKKYYFLSIVLSLLFILNACAAQKQEAGTQKTEKDYEYSYTACPLERNGIALHLDCMKVREQIRIKIFC